MGIFLHYWRKWAVLAFLYKALFSAPGVSRARTYRPTVVRARAMHQAESARDGTPWRPANQSEGFIARG